MEEDGHLMALLPSLLAFPAHASTAGDLVGHGFEQIAAQAPIERKKSESASKRPQGSLLRHRHSEGSRWTSFSHYHYFGNSGGCVRS